MLHAGFLPEPSDPDRKPFLDTLAKVSDLANANGVTIAFETGQETADLLRRTLDDLKCPNLKVNFDPANMLLYDKGDPIRAVELLAGHLRSVHVKDARRPKIPGTWGEEVPLGHGEVNIARFVEAATGGATPRRRLKPPAGAWGRLLMRGGRAPGSGAGQRAPSSRLPSDPAERMRRARAAQQLSSGTSMVEMRRLMRASTAATLPSLQAV